MLADGIKMARMHEKAMRKQEMQKPFVILSEEQKILGRTRTLVEAINWAKSSAKIKGEPYQVAQVLHVVKPGEAVVDEA